MNWKDYQQLKKGDYVSVGMLEGQYAFEVLTGVCDVPVYYPITSEEFEAFDDWKNDDEKIVNDIKSRKTLCSAYRNYQDELNLKGNLSVEDLETLAVTYFTVGKLSCSESVLLAMAVHWGLNDPAIPRIATPFRGGLCSTQQVCGAVSGGLMAIGLCLGRDSGNEDGKACVAMGKEFMNWAKGEFGSLCCRDMTGLDFTDEEQHKLFQQQRRGEVCVPLVAQCCRWLAGRLGQ